MDFDGVIHDTLHPLEGKRMGAPMDGARTALQKISLKFDVVVYSVRPDPNVISDWMKFYGIPFSRITNIKPQAVLYIDDKALRFTDWQTALSEIALHLMAPSTQKRLVSNDKSAPAGSG